ncbi:MAG: MetQ/NlpA family ABC transporter substrate-binding protein [Treponema sp.]|jgi:D-methionine transport system substrate-binding protein|nr:MetQ/NlpA family ABC transporter substrate-binding protein [Treponema sp.]
MKKLIGVIAVTLVLAALIQPVFAAPQKDGGVKQQTLKIGATPVPHAELLTLIKDDLKAQGVTLDVIEYNDYVQPNEALIRGDLDANFFQHIPYLESNAEWSAALVSAFGVHIEPFGLYSKKYTTLADIPDGALIAIPNDPSNGGRALLLLQAHGVITLKAGAGLEATVLDIAENPKNIQFSELEAAQLPRSLDDVDAATINGNYALQAGFNPLTDSLIIEGSESPYVNIVVVKKGAENDPRIQALKKSLLSQKVKEYIAKTWTDGSVVAIF